MDKFIDLGKPTKRGIKRCPSCNTINGTRGARCKNKKCNIILRDSNIKLINAASLSAFASTATAATTTTTVIPFVVQQQSISVVTNSDAIKLVTDSPLELVSVRVNNRGIDYRGMIELPTIQDMNGKLINCLSVYNEITTAAELGIQSTSHIDADDLNRLLTINSKCYIENCMKQQSKDTSSKLSLTPCQHILTAIKCTKEAQPIQLKSSSLSLLEITNEFKADIMQLACNTPGPLVQRVSKETFAVKCNDEEKYPFGYLHIYFHDTKEKTGSDTGASKKFSCTCTYFKKMVRLKICDLPSVKHHCIHYYSALATFLSDEELSKEFECVLYNREGNENRSLIRQVKEKKPLAHFHPTSPSSVSSSSASSPSSILNLNSNNTINNNLITINSSNTSNTINNNININTVNISNLTNSCTSAAVSPPPKKQQQKLLLNSQHQSDEAIVSTSANWLFTDWLSSVTEQINETMHYQLHGLSNVLAYKIPNFFFDCLQERIAASTNSQSQSSQSRKFRMPNNTQEILREDVPPLGSFVKYTWNIYSIFHVKSIFDTNTKSLDLQRTYVQKASTTYEHYQAEKHQQRSSYFYKTYLKVGKIRIDDIEQSIPFVIEWIPNLFPKTQVGELTIRFEFGHLKPNEVLA